ncbi:MAG TPA: sialidase family protein, partial [Puia sp.]|nr:sialidase family protein [Puia sp.]
GGASWDTAYFDSHLADPVCQGSIFAVGREKGHSIIAECNNDDSVQRNNLTLRISYDEGRSWTRPQVVDRSDEASKKKDYTAYSDIVGLSAKTIGVLYERNNYKEITFSILKWR